MRCSCSGRPVTRENKRDIQYWWVSHMSPVHRHNWRCYPGYCIEPYERTALVNLRLPLCAYFEPPPPGEDLPEDIVVQDPHDAGEGPLYFFVPVANGAAVRVAVCEAHARLLAAQFS
jgi:hypothetical protein